MTWPLERDYLNLKTMINQRVKKLFRQSSIYLFKIEQGFIKNIKWVIEQHYL